MIPARIIFMAPVIARGRLRVKQPRFLSGAEARRDAQAGRLRDAQAGRLRDAQAAETDCYKLRQNLRLRFSICASVGMGENCDSLWDTNMKPFLISRWEKLSRLVPRKRPL